MLEHIILGIAFIFTLLIIIVLYSRLTPDKVPENLAGYFGAIIKSTIAIVISVYVALFVVQLIFG